MSGQPGAPAGPQAGPPPGPGGYTFTCHKQFKNQPRLVRFKDCYEMKEELGKGGFGTVRRCVTKGGQASERKEMAAKINNTPDKAASQVAECDVVSAISQVVTRDPNLPITNAFPAECFQASRFVVNLYDSIREGDIVYNIYEIATGGDLQDEIGRQEFFQVDDAREAFRQICEGINHMHWRGWLHCDLKPMNVLIEHKRRKVYKIADFGLCQERDLEPAQRAQRDAAPPHERWNTPPLYQRIYRPAPHGARGTHMFNCPQKFNHFAYDDKSDWWSAACILYYLLAGYPPFYGTEQEIANQVNNAGLGPGQYPEYQSPEWDDPDLQEARDLLNQLFVMDYGLRLDYNGIMQHPFMQHPVPPLPVYQAFDHTLAEYNQRKFDKRNILRQVLGLEPLLLDPKTGEITVQGADAQADDDDDAAAAAAAGPASGPSSAPP